MRFRFRLARVIDNENCLAGVGPQPSFYRASDIAGIWKASHGFNAKSRQASAKTSLFLVGNGNDETGKIGANMACLGNLDYRIISKA
jgi:hypothetical protein